jgi:hypothetical protein
MTRTARTSPAANQPAANPDALALAPSAATLAAPAFPGQAWDYFFKCPSNHPITVWYHNTLLAGFNTQ